jgi:hypothetical protein
VLPYTGGAYSPSTTKALTFNNDLFLGDLKVQVKFQGKVLKLSEEMVGDQRWGMGAGTGGSCTCEPYWVYAKKVYEDVGCTRDDWSIEWCATPKGCGYEGSSVGKDGKPLWWDDCKPAEKSKPEPFDYIPAFTRVTVTAGGVRVKEGRAVRKILPEWANEKVISLTIKDEKGISNVHVEHNKGNAYTAAVHAQVFFTATAAGATVTGIIPDVLYTVGRCKLKPALKSPGFSA